MADSSMSLYKIEADLAQLMELRDEAEDDVERAVCDDAIAQYLAREVRKVDGIVEYIRFCDAREAEVAEQIDALLSHKHRWENRGSALRAATFRAMREHGLTKLEGSFGMLEIRANPASVVIDNPVLIPDEYQRVKAAMGAGMWRTIAELMESDPRWQAADKRIDKEISKFAIALAIKNNVDVPGARMVPGLRLEVK